MYEYTKVSRLLVVIIAAAFLFSVTGEGRAAGVRNGVQTQGTIRYLSGGVGFGERALLSQEATNAKMNLELVFDQRNGAFLSAAPLKITDAGGTTRLQVTSADPWLFVRLPAGEYHYRADYDGHVQTGSLTAPKTGCTKTVLSFS